jgi:hypothetical protein
MRPPATASNPIPVGDPEAAPSSGTEPTGGDATSQAWAAEVAAGAVAAAPVAIKLAKPGKAGGMRALLGRNKKAGVSAMAGGLAKTKDTAALVSVSQVIMHLPFPPLDRCSPPAAQQDRLCARRVLRTLQACEEMPFAETDINACLGLHLQAS